MGITFSKCRKPRPKVDRITPTTKSRALPLRHVVLQGITDKHVFIYIDTAGRMLTDSSAFLVALLLVYKRST